MLYTHKISWAFLSVGVFLCAGCSTPKDDVEKPIEDVVTPSDSGLGEDTQDSFVLDAGLDLAPPEPPRTGTITGRIVNREGKGLGSLKILCCTSSLCVSGDTSADGSYEFEDLELESEELLAEARKMQVVDLSGSYMESLFYQEVVLDQSTPLGRDVVMPPDDAENQLWSAEEGGEVSLAKGVLRFTALPDSLIYPFGFTEDQIRGLQIPASEIPPQNEEPWLGLEEDSLAFLMSPVDVRSKEPLGLRIEDGIERPVGSQFTVWSLDNKGEMQPVGTATVEDDLAVVGDGDCLLLRVTLVVLVPEKD